MPFETIVIKPANTSNERTHEQVAEDISAAFENIKKRSGSFVTTLSLADKSGYSGEGGHPDGAAYIVAEFPEAQVDQSSIGSRSTTERY